MLSRGDRINRYEVVDLLGSGGMGEVYRARDPTLDRHVAIKILRGDSPLGAGARARLLREARSVAALSHVNVLTVHDAGEIEEPEAMRGLAYIAMELVVGTTLRARIDDPTASVEERAGWLRDVARGLAAAHEIGIVHRDVKPENVMIRTDGTVKVLDFGIARTTDLTVEQVSSIDAHSLPTIKALDGLAEPPPPSTGNGIAGTVPYMAPEQLRGEAIDRRTDQFAWGVVAYELLTGRLPWGRGRDAILLVSRILSLDPPRLAEVDPAIPRPLSDAVARALSKDAADRFPSMDALIAAMGPIPAAHAEAAGVAAGPLARTVRSNRPRRAVLLSWTLAATGVAGLVIVATRLALPSIEPAATERPRLTAVPPEAGSLFGDDDTSPSSDGEAQRAYDEALRAYHDGTGRAVVLLRQAVERDARFAGASLRLAILGDDVDHADYRRTVALDASLRPRERTLLSAYEGYVAGGEQARGAGKTLDAYLEAHPHDEIAWAERWKLARLEGKSQEIEVLDRAIAANPSSLHVLAIRAALFPEETDGLTLMDRCLRSNPRAVDCIARSLELDSQRGACDEEGADARRLLVLQPDSVAGREALANALAAGGAPVASIAEALGPGDDVGSARLGIPRAAMLPMLQGNFVEVERVARERLGAVGSSRSTEEHLAPTLALLAAYEESGDFAAAARVAEDFQARISAWNDPGAWSFLDGRLSGVRARGGRLAPAEASARKAALFERLVAGGTDRYEAWGEAYGSSVVTEKEAQEAVAHFDEMKLSTETPHLAFEVVQAFVLAGQGKRLTRERVERVARDCFLVTEPARTLRAHLYFGRLEEEAGETAGACAEYAKVLARWNDARPRSRAADDARARSVGLRCRR